MNEKRAEWLLEHLSETEYQKASLLAAGAGVSNKTILKDIDALNEDMRTHGARIEKTPRMGCRIIVTDPFQFRSYRHSMHADGNLVEGLLPRQAKMIRLLFAEKYVKEETLCEQFYISRTALSQDLKTIRGKLKEYRLELHSRPYYGLYIEGREFDRRLCLAGLVIAEMDQRNAFPGPGLDKMKLLQIARIADSVCQKYEINMSEVSEQNLFVHIYIALDRISHGHLMKTDDPTVENISTWTEDAASREICRKLEEVFPIRIDEKDRVYITLHLAAKRYVDAPDQSMHKIMKDLDTNRLAEEMIAAMDRKWHTQLAEDQNLKDALSMHLVPMEVRMRYGCALRNPLKYEIMQRYPAAFAMTADAAEVLAEYYGKPVRSDELSYLTMHTACALADEKATRKLKNLIVVCGTGVAAGRLFGTRLRSRFGRYISEIKAVERTALMHSIAADTDAVITTVPIRTKLPVPSIEVHYFPTDEDDKRLEAFLQKEKKTWPEVMPEECYAVTQVKDRADAIRKLADLLSKNGLVSEDCYESILKRDDRTRMEYDNLSACVFMDGAEANRDAVILMVFEEAVIWHTRKVKAVFLPVCRAMDRSALEMMDMTAACLSNPFIIRQAVKGLAYTELMEVLKNSVK